MDHVISYLSRRKAVPAGLWHHEVKQSYDPAAVFEEQLKKYGMGERNPSARFAGTSPFRGGQTVEKRHVFKRGYGVLAYSKEIKQEKIALTIRFIFWTAAVRKDCSYMLRIPSMRA